MARNERCKGGQGKTELENGGKRRGRGGGERSFKGWEWPQNGRTVRASSLPISRAFIRLRDLGMNFATCNELVTDRANVQRF